jgi:epoxyqueuosine reductase
MALEADIKQRAAQVGFSPVGITSATLPSLHGQFLERWLDRGSHGEMAYMARAPQRRSDPSAVLPGAKSIISLAMNYFHGDHGAPPHDRSGKVARYAWGADYHTVIERKLEALEQWLREREPSLQSRRYVDHGPVLERAVAQEAGLGFIGKNTMLITESFGSWVFLAELITNLDLAPDPPQTTQCGSCRLCLDACPTNAFTGPFELDATRCISYLTIELKSEIPESQRAGLGEWFFGCDVCQEVCPYNHQTPATAEPAFHHGTGPWINLARIVAMQSEEEMKSFAGTPLTRPKRAGLVRNATAVATNRLVL